MLRLLLLIFFAFNIIDGKYVLVETEDSSEAGKVVEPVHVVGQVPQAYEVNFKYIRKQIEHLLLPAKSRLYKWQCLVWVCGCVGLSHV